MSPSAGACGYTQAESVKLPVETKSLSPIVTTFFSVVAEALPPEKYRAYRLLIFKFGVSALTTEPVPPISILPPLGV